uniref:Uncharacterized protein n=1 Tax=Amphimedon queenslandica TaxID=400682 RepID=A0A1X7VBI2_AMPQE
MKDDIGCFTNSVIKAARINFSAIVTSVGCDQQAFIDRLRSLAKYHAKNVHEWEGGKCFCHDLIMLQAYVSTSLGLIQSNMSWMYVHKGPAYH